MGPRAHDNGGTASGKQVQAVNPWGFVVKGVSRVARVTGRPMEGETMPNPNNTAEDWNVGGTDLGVIWEMEPEKYGIAFGDTYGRDFVPDPPNGGDWRCNVVGFSEDKDLADGLTLSGMVTDDEGDAMEIIYGGKDQSNEGNWTSIPTAAIRANGADYIHYFNMKQWVGWITNYSGMYKSEDDGQTWVKCEDVVFGSDSYFGQGGYFKKDGYVYMIGTETGREKPARVARFREADIENLENYEYWNGTTGKWVRGDESSATVIIDGKVGELSFIYNDTYKKWIIIYYTDDEDDRYIAMRTASEINGPWSEPYMLVHGTDYHRLYGSYFHPLSTTGNELYFTMSMWMPYNVFLMKVELEGLGE